MKFFLMSVNHRRLVAFITEEVAVNVPRVLIASACLLVVSWANSVEVVDEVSYPHPERLEEVIKALDLTNTGNVTFDEFKKVFIGDKRTSASM